MSPLHPPPGPLDAAQVEALCRLARIDLGAEERRRLGSRLQAVLEAFAATRAVDTHAVSLGAADTAAHNQALRQAGPLRPDAAVTQLPAHEVLANAPRTAGCCFLVPRVVDG